MAQARTANEIVGLFINGRDLKWERRGGESAMGTRDCEWTAILLTRKQWKWLLDIWQRENTYEQETAGGTLPNGTVWDASYTGYYHSGRNGTAKLQLRRYENNS